MPKTLRAHEDSVRLSDAFLGKKKPKEDPRTLVFADYLPGGRKAAKKITSLPTPPASLDYQSPIAQFPTYYNDVIGDCGPAMVGHAEQIWTGNVGNLWTPDPAQVLKVYEDVGGYRPTDPNNPQTNSTDQGIVMLDLMNYWRHTGIGGHQIAFYAKVDPTDRVQIKQAVYLGGCVQMGLALPKTAATQLQQSKTRWTVVSTTSSSGKPGSWGGHAVPGGRYTTQTLNIVTWGMQFGMTWGFCKDYCDELYVAFSPDWINQVSKKAPNGIDVNAIEADIKQFAPAA